MAEQYQIFNGPAPSTASQVAVTTGTAIKTLLQVKLGTQSRGRIIEWGISFDGSAAATPIIVELFECSIFATGTASVAADIAKFDPNGVAPDTSAFIVGTAATMYTATAEGTVANVRMFDAQQIAPTNQYIKQFPLGREPMLDVSKSLRVRVKAGTAVNAICYVTIEI